MRIQELSVGDWVRYRDREWQVCSLYQFTEEVGLWRKDSQLCETITDIQPIPLTSEILEKNGFVKHNKFYDTYEYTTLLGTTLRQCIVTKYNSKQFNTLTAREEDTKKEGNDLERLSKHLDLIIPEVCVHHLQYLFRKIHPNKEIQL